MISGDDETEPEFLVYCGMQASGQISYRLCIEAAVGSVGCS